MGSHSNGTPFRTGEHAIMDPTPLRILAPMFPTALGFNTFTSPGPRPFFFITPNGSGSTEGGFPGFPAPQSANEMPAHPIPLSTSNGAAHVGEVTGANGSLNESALRTSLNGYHDPLFNTPSPASGKKMKRQHAPLSSAEEGSLIPFLTAAGTEKKKKKRWKKPKNFMTHDELLALPSSSEDPRESVEALMMTYDALRRRLTQLDEVNNLGLSRCPHLKAGTIMSNKDLRANPRRRIGPVPGVEVGDIFYFRVEMYMIGLHMQSVAGIDYVKLDKGEESVALSIVSSGGYDNVDGDVDVLIYSGQGGFGGSNSKGEKKLPDDQKLERGNLALENSLRGSSEIRVIRCEKDITCQTGKIYIYDGVYKISESWEETGKSGFKLFKYKLLRQPDQPEGIAVWKNTQKWIEDPSSRGTVILPDISSGVENMPVCLVNDVDDEKGPSHFIYATKVNYLVPLSTVKPLHACSCESCCLPDDANCACAKQNGGDLPYSANGLLVRRQHLVYECGASCGCTNNCRNRLTQMGIKLHFEVFRTRGRGWGLRSWDPIRAGTFICEYVGDVIDKIKVDEDGEDDEYIFHTMHADDRPFDWNYGPELQGDPSIVKPNESYKPLPIILSAKRMGNISRFMNHSCSPNVFWQPVLHDHSDEAYPHIMFFATKHIPPMTELTYDYGISTARTGVEETTGGAGFRSSRMCLCGSSKCRGVFG